MEDENNNSYLKKSEHKLLSRLYEITSELNEDQKTLLDAIRTYRTQINIDDKRLDLIFDCLEQAISVRWNETQTENMLEIITQLSHIGKQRLTILSHPYILKSVEPKKYESLMDTYISYNKIAHSQTIEIQDLCDKCDSHRNCQFRSVPLCPLMKKIPNSERCMCNTNLPLPYCSDCICEIVTQKIIEKTTIKIDQSLDCIIKCFVCNLKICIFEIITVLKIDKNLECSPNQLSTEFISPISTRKSVSQQGPKKERQRRCTICHQVSHIKTKCPTKLGNTQNSIIEDPAPVKKTKIEEQEKQLSPEPHVEEVDVITRFLNQPQTEEPRSVPNHVITPVISSSQKVMDFLFK